MTIRILVADDHLLIRQGLRMILETEPDLELVGEADDGLEAVRLCHELQPDVVLMDLRMPNLDGIGAIERLREELPGVAVVILTTFNEDELMLRGLRAGAKGFLLKDTGREQLFHSIRAAARGEVTLAPGAMSVLLERIESPHLSERHSGELLSERELEVLRAVAKGERSKEIAFRLRISERTVKAHLTNIYGKLGVDSRAAAIAEASRRQLL